MALGNKSPQLAPPYFSQFVRDISKMAFIDLAWDLLVRMHGEDEMQDDEKATQFFIEAFGPIARVRGDRMPKLPRNREV